KLPGHLVSDQPSVAKAPQQVRTLRLNAAHEPDMGRRHLLNGVWNPQAIEGVRCERIEWLVGPQVVRQVETVERVALPCPVQIEKGSSGAGRLHRYERSSGVLLCSGLQGLRQLFDGRSGEERGEGELLAK